MMENQPNLFTYATSELSQDAFICWFAAWAKPEYKDINNGLPEVARRFLVSLIEKVQKPFDGKLIKTVDISRQKASIDVLIEINRNMDDRLAILIEDKTHSGFHTEQQIRYPGIVTKKHSYTSNQIIPIYFKTGYQSRFSDLAEFEPYLRKDFLTVLQEGSKTITNAIFCDFLAHLKKIDFSINQFLMKDLTVSEGELAWNDYDRQGLFMYLYKIFSKTDEKANWGYVANKSGGFFGFWWDFEVSTQNGYWSYLQLEGDKLCYKIGFSNEVYKGGNWKVEAQKIKLIWSNILLKLDGELTTRNTKIGQTMTLAKINNILRSNEGRTLDLDKTVLKLYEAQEVLKEARRLANISEKQ